MTEAVIFYFFGAITLLAGFGVVAHRNPIMSALHLVAAMVGVSGLFFNLHAPFIAAVQLAVYAGAVMVLFLFVVMIFDLKNEGRKILSLGMGSQLVRLSLAVVVFGFLLYEILFRLDPTAFREPNQAPQFEVRNLSLVLFTDYLFVFEVLGLLLLVIPIGTVALSRIRGGTHAK